VTDHDIDLDAFCPLCSLELVAGRCPECDQAAAGGPRRMSRAERNRRLDAAALGCTVVAILAVTPMVTFAFAGLVAWGPWGALAGAVVGAVLWVAALAMFAHRHGVPLPVTWTDPDLDPDPFD
jgi:peptidoglycan/LPS O-acetylase OafA/YrhL